MSAVDTSVLVPALVGWHEHHDPCRRAVIGARVPAHVMIETYSVLTRLPSPHRLTASVAHQLVTTGRRADDVLTVPPRLQRSLVTLVAELGIEGGATYDALVGLTAQHHGEVLLTRDRRATRTYELLEVGFRLVVD